MKETVKPTKKYTLVKVLPLATTIGNIQLCNSKKTNYFSINNSIIELPPGFILAEVIASGDASFKEKEIVLLNVRHVAEVIEDDYGLIPTTEIFCVVEDPLK